MAGEKKRTVSESEDVDGILVDIEGTTSSISFVKVRRVSLSRAIFVLYNPLNSKLVSVLITPFLSLSLLLLSWRRRVAAAAAGAFYILMLSSFYSDSTPCVDLLLNFFQFFFISACGNFKFLIMGPFDGKFFLLKKKGGRELAAARRQCRHRRQGQRPWCCFTSFSFFYQVCESSPSYSNFLSFFFLVYKSRVSSILLQVPWFFIQALELFKKFLDCLEIKKFLIRWWCIFRGNKRRRRRRSHLLLRHHRVTVSLSRRIRSHPSSKLSMYLHFHARHFVIFLLFV